MARHLIVISITLSKTCIYDLFLEQWIYLIHLNLFLNIGTLLNGLVCDYFVLDSRHDNTSYTITSIT